MKFLTKLLTVLVLGSFAATQVGCATLRKDLPTILTYVQDGAIILASIQGYANMFFLAHPNTSLQNQINGKLTDAETALDAALHATQGTQDLTDAQYAAAFAPFMAAYNDLLALGKTIGIIPSATVSVPLRASATQLIVPTPMVAAKVSH